jgi:tetratricopeptide (TPR) repeat protein
VRETLQTGGSAGGAAARHVVYGDLKVEERSGENLPQNYTVVLKHNSGTIFGRINISPNGRFRFNSVPNAELILSVEVEHREVYRERFVLNIQNDSDVRKDIELAWAGQPGPTDAPGTVYARSSSNQKLYDEAQEEASNGDLKKAASLMEKAVKDDSEDFEAWTELGTVHFRREKYKDAEKCYGKALEARPDYMLALINLGRVRIAEKKYQEALEPLNRALELEPERAASNRLVGEAYLGLKQGSKAVGYLNKAISLDPVGMADVHLRLGQLYGAAGYGELAAKEYEQYLEKKPDSPHRADVEKALKKLEK